MIAGDDIRQLVVIVMVALAVGGLVLALFYPLLATGRPDARLRTLAGARRSQPAPGKVSDGPKDGRRRKIQESLKQIEARETDRRKRVTLRMLIARSGLTLSVRTFWVVSGFVGGVFAIIPLWTGIPWYLCLLSGFVGFLGVPRWFLGYMRKRRQEAFLSDLPDAIDVMVRGLKSGLPLSDALKVIANETAPPIGPEFWELVEGQRIGITIEQGLERMFERMPVQEVSFLAIVMNIQSKTGGNLTETLSNLAKVLRDRRKMKSRIRSVSQEAKSSAAIIGALPFLIAGALIFLNPDYLSPLFDTTLGNTMLVFSGFWMLAGILVMRKMINFNI